MVQTLKYQLMDYTGLRPFPCPYQGCEERLKAQTFLNDYIKFAKKHAGDCLASKSIDEQCPPCPYEGCDERFKTRTLVKHHIWTAEKHAADRLASKSIDKQRLSLAR